MINCADRERITFKRCVPVVILMQMCISEHPKYAICVFVYVDSHIAGQAFFIKWIVQEFSETITIITVKPIMCGNPQITFAVLKGRINDIIGKSVLNCKTNKGILLRCRCAADKKACKKKEFSLHA